LVVLIELMFTIYILYNYIICSLSGFRRSSVPSPDGTAPVPEVYVNPYYLSFFTRFIIIPEDDTSWWRLSLLVLFGLHYVRVCQFVILERSTPFVHRQLSAGGFKKRHCLQKPLQSYNIFVRCSLFLSLYSIYFILFDFILLYFMFNNIFLKLIAGVSQQRLSSKHVNFFLYKLLFLNQ